MKETGEAVIKIRLDELSGPLRATNAVGDEESIVIEDQNGQGSYVVIG
jgi:hypothetical protein